VERDGESPKVYPWTSGSYYGAIKKEFLQ